MKEGLYGKYIIKKADGSEIANNARYFVLRYDGYGGEKEARNALLYYANAISKDNPKLMEDLCMEIAKAISESYNN